MNVVPTLRGLGLTSCVTVFLLIISCAPRGAETRQAPLILVKKMVYHDGWRICGLIRVESDGSYIYKTINVWSQGQTTKVLHGQIPPSLLTQLAEVARGPQIQAVGATPTYEYYVDDHHHLTMTPAAIKTLMQVVGSAYH
jgi:hypothetical protein